MSATWASVILNEQGISVLKNNGRVIELKSNIEYPRLALSPFLFSISIFRGINFTKGNAKEQKLKTRRSFAFPLVKLFPLKILMKKEIEKK